MTKNKNKKSSPIVYGNRFFAMCYEDIAGAKPCQLPHLCATEFKFRTIESDFVCELRYETLTELINPIEFLNTKLVAIIFNDDKGNFLGRYQFAINGVGIRGGGSKVGEQEIFGFDVRFSINLESFIVKQIGQDG